MLDVSMAAARHHGLASVLGFSGALQGEMFLRRGRFTEAVLSSVLDVDLNDTPDLPTASFGQAVLARVEAILGRTYSARMHADDAIARARRVGMRVLETWGLSALGHVALTTGNYVEAAEHLRRVHRLHAEVLDAGDLWYQGDLIEALLAIGAVDETADVVAEVTAKADLSRSKWGAAVARRGQGMLHGRPDDLRQSAEELAELGAPFEQGTEPAAARRTSWRSRGVTCCAAHLRASRRRAVGRAGSPDRRARRADELIAGLAIDNDGAARRGVDRPWPHQPPGGRRALPQPEDGRRTLRGDPAEARRPRPRRAGPVRHPATWSRTPPDPLLRRAAR